MKPESIDYTPLEHTADSGFLVRAPSWERLYIHAALALTDQMVKLSSISESEKLRVSVEAESKERLMVKWLNEILFQFEKNRFLCKRIVFEKFSLSSIKSSLWGEKYVPSKHGHFSEIKAVTYHQLVLGETLEEHQFFAKIFLDL